MVAICSTRESVAFHYGVISSILDEMARENFLEI